MGAPSFSSGSVANSAELQRILALPRRTMTDAEQDALAAEMTALLKRPEGTQSLRRLQALALHDIGTLGGAFCAVEVGGGKCLGKGTPVLMFDGTIKNVEDVIVGDLLMGPDSLARTVVSTVVGNEELYRVVPTKGDPYVVNESHILSLKKTRLLRDAAFPSQAGGQIKNISVRDILAKPDQGRAMLHNWKGYRVGATFPHKDVVEPYILGLWLGDGSTDSAAITSADPEIQTEIHAFSRRFGVSYRVTNKADNAASTYLFTTGFGKPRYNKNPVTAWLREIEVLGNKHVPHDYKANSPAVQLEVLAGLLDSDGHHHNGGFEYSSKLERLADDVCFLARSLGLAAFKVKCRKQCTNNGVWGDYFRVGISGDCSVIPTRIPRKRANPRLQKKSVSMTGIRLEPLGAGDYYGFELAGPDRLFLLGDFTVTHNTLTAMLAPYILGAQRPMMFQPAGLLGKTKKDMLEVYGPHWLIPNNIRLFSYEMLGRSQSASELEDYRPDLIIGDEIHKLRNPDAAVTKRVIRYMQSHPDTKFVALSGTIMDRSLLEFAHILQWCLKGNAPVPLTEGDLHEWAAAVDIKGDFFSKYEPGALVQLAGDQDKDEEDIVRARRGFQRRLIETPGVIATTGAGEHVGASIRIRFIEYDVSDETEQHLHRLRAEMKMSDDWDLTTPMEVWAHAREMALELSYHWDPRPPDEWRNPRKAWFKFLRRALTESAKSGGQLDSESQVTDAVRAGQLPGGAHLLEAWEKVKDTFTPNVVPVWHGDGVIDVCAKWMKQRPGIVWTEHTLFAERLAERTGIKYYGRKGLAADGEYIGDASPKRSVIASIDANKEGRNLQKQWSRNLFTSPCDLPGVWQQAIGRTHRSGQEADEVEVDILLGCLEHANAWRRAYAGARAIRDTTGQEHKFLIADIENWPGDDEIAKWTGARWVVPPPEKFEIPV